MTVCRKGLRILLHVLRAIWMVLAAILGLILGGLGALGEDKSDGEFPNDDETAGTTIFTMEEHL